MRYGLIYKSSIDEENEQMKILSGSIARKNWFQIQVSSRHSTKENFGFKTFQQEENYWLA